MNQEHPIFIPSTPKWQQSHSPHEYGEACELYGMFGQITRVIFRKNAVGPSQAINQYLQQCGKGEHVLLKSFSSFSKGSLNRLCFLSNFIKIFELDVHSRNGLDYFQLFRLLCSDFPKEVVTRCVNLLSGQPISQVASHENMAKIVDSKNFIRALYIFLIYGQYIEGLTKYFEKGKGQKSILEIYQFSSDCALRSKNHYEQPQFGLIVQTLLRHLRKNNLLGQQCKVRFLTEETIREYFQQKLGKEDGSSLKMNCQTFLKFIVQSPEHIISVQEHLAMFEPPTNWATEVSKIINIKEGGQTPLNTKKVKPKK